MGSRPEGPRRPLPPPLPASPLPSPSLPALVAAAGGRAELRFLEFFASNIRNPHTRRAYGRAAGEFLAWCADKGIVSLTAVQPLHVATWIEAQTRALSPPSVKQRLAALRHLFDWLVTGQIVPINPAASVRGPSHVVKSGKTPVLDAEEARRLLASIDTTQALMQTRLRNTMRFWTTPCRLPFAKNQGLVPGVRPLDHARAPSAFPGCAPAAAKAAEALHDRALRRVQNAARRRSSRSSWLRASSPGSPCPAPPWGSTKPSRKRRPTHEQRPLRWPTGGLSGRRGAPRLTLLIRPIASLPGGFLFSYCPPSRVRRVSNGRARSLAPLFAGLPCGPCSAGQRAGQTVGRAVEQVMAAARILASDLPLERRKALLRLWAFGTFNASGLTGPIWNRPSMAQAIRTAASPIHTWAALIVAGVRDDLHEAMAQAEWAVSRLKPL